MERLGERARALQELEDLLRKELHEVLAEAGSHLLKKPEEVEGVDLAEIRGRESAITDQILEVEKNREQITEIQDDLETTGSRSGEIQAELKTLSENMDPIFEEIGTLSFNLYRGNPLVDQEYTTIFTPLVEVYSELAGIEAAISEQQEMVRDKPFLEKMVIRGRIALLKNRQTTREGSFRRLTRTAGKEIMSSAFVDEIGDPSLSKAAEPYRERLATTRALESELDRINAERAALAEALAELGVSRKASRRLEELDSDLLTLGQTRDTVRAEIARSLSGAPADDLPAKCKPLLALAEEILSKIGRVEAIAARVKSGLLANRLQSTSAQIQSDMERKEERQAELKKELTMLRSQKKETDAALADAVAARGSVAELLADDLLDKL